MKSAVSKNPNSLTVLLIVLLSAACTQSTFAQEPQRNNKAWGTASVGPSLTHDVGWGSSIAFGNRVYYQVGIDVDSGINSRASAIRAGAGLRKDFDNYIQLAYFIGPAVVRSNGTLYAPSLAHNGSVYFRPFGNLGIGLELHTNRRSSAIRLGLLMSR